MGTGIGDAIRAKAGYDVDLPEDDGSRLTGIAVNAAGIPPDKISFPRALAAATATVAAFPP